MKATVIGIQQVDYTSRKTGSPVKGYTLHVVNKDAQVDGYSVSNVFVSDNLGIPGVNGIRPGTRIDVEYNNRGYVCGLEILSRPENAISAIDAALAFSPVSSAPASAPAPFAPKK